MKTKYYAPVAAVVAGVILSSCANQPAQPQAARSVERDPGHRVYTQEQLRNTGHDNNVGRALEQLDPAVSARGQ